ncbi:hypothetical protein CMQ_6504 [Grosmannia clavigera kw1407]|uniref:DUF6546 domain-containing protein n=1 Tax=Grosmannia clavigera (strain kw1407 / UAMH 11150) TaxID=655863 RepID=F0X7M9_GROCL|nr:uncharacterized protein CMQ_6504 [Grosmannia clavigera kw1407]EFX06183.1 hypothetical protein CMQ_6504 [Grosmannia clavigera kw1407]
MTITMASWDSLPAELRLTILEYVAGANPNFTDAGPRESSARHTYYCAPYATVSRDWQVFFERRTFAAIALFNDDVQPFCDAVGRCVDRLEYIGRLRLTIDLPEYSCGECETDEDAATVKRHVDFTRYLWLLLRSLAAWKIPGQEERQLLKRSDKMFALGSFNSAVGIQLELGVRSISDSQHAFRDYRIYNPYGNVHRTREDFHRYYRDVSAQQDSATHGWLRGVRKLLPPPVAIRRVLGARLLELDADGLGGETRTETERSKRYLVRHELPAAAIVTKLVFSRQFYRAVHPATLSYLLRICFPQIMYLHLEPWRPVDAANLGAMERGYCTVLANLPPSLIGLSIFLETNYIIHHRDKYAVHPGATLTDRRPSPQVGRQLAEGSGSLVVISVAFLAEADDFFAAVARMPAKTWPRLKTIVLTSSTLTPASSPADVEQLLLAAAAAAVRMPRLRQVELWFARGPHACAFTVTGARLRLRATWNVTRALTADVVRAWRAVCQNKTHRHLHVTTELWACPNSQTNMDARMLVLNGDALVRLMIQKESLLDMCMPGTPANNAVEDAEAGYIQWAIMATEEAESWARVAAAASLDARNAAIWAATVAPFSMATTDAEEKADEAEASLERVDEFVAVAGEAVQVAMARAWDNWAESQDDF